MKRFALSVAALLLVNFLVHPSLAAPAAQSTKSDSKSVIPVFELTGEVTETPPDEMAALFGAPGVSLRDLVARLRKAADDSNVKAVVVTIDGGSLGLAQIEEVRQAIQKLRDAGKNVYANADSLSIGSYVLLCGATRLSVVPTADLWITGLYGEQPYIHSLLAKLGVKPEFLHCG